MIEWSVRRSTPSPSSDWRRLARRADPTPSPQRTQREYGTEPDCSSTTHGHDRRQGRRLCTDDRRDTAHHEDRVDRPRPAIVGFSEDVVEQFVELIATALEVLESNQRARPRRNDHRRLEVDIGLPLLHVRECIRISSEQPQAPSSCNARADGHPNQRR
jgi:hypothetical protein